MERLRAFHCSIFTGGVIAADGICSAALPRPGKGFISDGKVSDKTVKSADALAPPRGAVAQRLRGYKSAEPEKTVKRSSRQTGVNLQFFPVQPSSLGLKGASSPFFVAPARRNRWWFSGSLLPPKENIPRQAEPSPRSAFKIVPLPEISQRLPALRRSCFAPAAPAR